MTLAGGAAVAVDIQQYPRTAFITVRLAAEGWKEVADGDRGISCGLGGEYHSITQLLSLLFLLRTLRFPPFLPITPQLLPLSFRSRATGVEREILCRAQIDRSIDRSIGLAKWRSNPRRKDLPARTKWKGAAAAGGEEKRCWFGPPSSQ